VTDLTVKTFQMRKKRRTLDFNFHAKKTPQTSSEPAFRMSFTSIMALLTSMKRFFMVKHLFSYNAHDKIIKCS